MGLDVGTSGCRAVLFDEEFAVRGKGTSSLSLRIPQPQWAEQDANEVRRAVLRAIRACLTSTGVPPGEILALSLSGVLYSLLAVDEHGDPLLPLIQWSDNRAEAQARRLEGPLREAGIYHKTGCRNNAMYLPAKILWIKEERPFLYRRARRLISVKDYVAQSLTGGDFVSDTMVASASGLFNLHERSWDPDVLRLLDLSEDLLPPLIPPQGLLGGIRREVAAKTGLLEGTPVYAGGGDGPLSNVGAGVIEPNQLNLSISSGGILRMILDRPRLCAAERTWCYLLKEDLWVLGGVNNGGMVLDWFWRSFWGKGGPGGGSEKRRFALLDAWAASAPAGSEGLIFLPYLTGERSPHWRTDARAGFFGIHSYHHRAHFARAVMEGLGYQMRTVYLAMEEVGGDVRETRFTGGFVRSALWTQLMCDILGRPALLPVVDESSALGAVAFAALGMGMIPHLASLKEKIKIGRILQPDEETHQYYLRLHGLFSRLYRDSTEGWSELQEILKTRPGS